MKITDILRGEHGVFYSQFNKIEKSLKTGSLSEVQAQVAILTAGLSPHAKMENEILFSSLDSHFNQMGPLEVMRTEHDEIEDGLNQLAKVQDLAQAQKLLRHVIEIARDHFLKEEQILFVMAEEFLDEKTLNKLGAKWLKKRGVATSGLDNT